MVDTCVDHSPFLHMNESCVERGTNHRAAVWKELHTYIRNTASMITEQRIHTRHTKISNLPLLDQHSNSFVHCVGVRHALRCFEDVKFAISSEYCLGHFLVDVAFHSSIDVHKTTGGPIPYGSLFHSSRIMLSDLLFVTVGCVWV